MQIRPAEQMHWECGGARPVTWISSKHHWQSDCLTSGQTIKLKHLSTTGQMPSN